MKPESSFRYSREKAGWLRLALVPFRVRRLPDKAADETYVSKYGPPIWLENIRSKKKQRAVYRALLNSRWLAPMVRVAIVTELGMSIRKERLRGAQVQAKFWHAEIDEIVRRMRENGDKPQHGSRRQAAVTRIADRDGISVEALEQRLKRAARRARK
jgi:hypothetical protein